MGDLRTYGTLIGPVKGHSVRDTDIDEQVCMAAVTTIGSFQMFFSLDEKGGNSEGISPTSYLYY